MIKGKIKRPANTKLLDNQRKQSEIDLFYSILELCKVEVEDNHLKDKINKIHKSLEDFRGRIVGLEKKQEAKYVELLLFPKLKEELARQALIINDVEGRIKDATRGLSVLRVFEDRIDDLMSTKTQNLQEIKSLKEDVEKLKKIKSVEFNITINNKPTVSLSKQHKSFAQLLKIVSCHLNAYVVGPAGSGKTTAAENCADALGVPFYFTGAIASEYKLTGFIDAQGKIVSTDFRKAYSEGGLFLFDEIDASYPQAVLAFNAALANEFMDFPDGRINKHPDFYCIAAANTFGQGADRQYVGRNQLDAASLDRFVFVEWEYDEQLELEISGNDKWVKYVQKIRNVIFRLNIRHVVSPRASIYGAKLLAGGLAQKEVEELVIWKGMDLSTRNKVISNL